MRLALWKLSEGDVFDVGAARLFLPLNSETQSSAVLWFSPFYALTPLPAPFVSSSGLLDWLMLRLNPDKGMGLKGLCVCSCSVSMWLGLKAPEAKTV